MKAVLFDLDGVLVDSFEAHRRAFDMVMKRHFGFGVSREEFLMGFGKDPREITADLLENHGVRDKADIAQLNAEKQVSFRTETIGYVKTFPGARQLLTRLQERKVKTALASSSTKANITLMLEKTGLKEYLKIIVGLEDTNKGKPHPDLYLKAAEKLGVKPEECWVVEDSLHGIEAGRKAGMKVVGVETGMRSRGELEGAGADLVVENLEKLSLEDLNIK